ncbi:MFS transporter [Photobacterium galatheae]|uniref:MFS transporter n=1 Tax=Photobacterium galatheae TaxID=1654360 RepID=UPI00202CD9E1|nr:MFS transporter [Photobacterium galatheae]MCM0148787.1 MFS transporter [Photobacterium galatheae]
MYQRLVESLSLYKGLPRDIYFIAIARFILGLGNFIIPFMTLLLTQKQGYSTAIAGTLVMVVTGTYMLGGLIGGKLSDTYGHKRTMVCGEFLVALVLLMCGFFAEHHTIAPALMCIAFFLIGIALPASIALVADHSNPKNRDAVMSLSYLAYNLGSAVGPVVAGYLFWHHTAWIYWGNGFAALIGILIVWFRVSDGHHDTTNTELSALEKATDSSVWAVFRERPRLLIFGGLCTLLWFALNQMTMTGPLYFSHVFAQDSAVLFGQLMTFASVVVVMTTPLLIRMTRNQSEPNSLAIAGVLFAIGYAIIAQWTAIWVIFFAWFLLSAAEVLLLTKEGVYLANHSPSSHRGRISGILITIRNIGLMPTYAFIGAYIQSNGYSSAWMLILSVASLAAIGFWLLLIQQRSAQQSTPSAAVIEPTNDS